MDFDDFFFVLLTRIIARSLARFYLPSCQINISIYVFFPHATLKGTSAFLEELNYKVNVPKSVHYRNPPLYTIYTHIRTHTHIFSDVGTKETHFYPWHARRP